MAKTIPDDLGRLLRSRGPCAHADTLLIDGIDVDEQSASRAPEARHVDDGRRVDATARRRNATPPSAGHREQPPITRWDYPAFSVYFEHDRVIHAVARRQ